METALKNNDFSALLFCLRTLSQFAFENVYLQFFKASAELKILLSKVKEKICSEEGNKKKL
jgi:hypothetical protein